MKRLTEEFNEAVVKKGQVFTIELIATIWDGYRWELEVKAGKAKPLHQHFEGVAKKGDIKEIYIYRAMETGIIKIEAQYKQKNKPPAKLKNFSITVE